MRHGPHLTRSGFLLALLLAAAGIAAVAVYGPGWGVLRWSLEQPGWKLAAFGSGHVLVTAMMRRSRHLRITPLSWALPLTALAATLPWQQQAHPGLLAATLGAAAAVLLALTLLPGRGLTLPPGKLVVI